MTREVKELTKRVDDVSNRLGETLPPDEAARLEIKWLLMYAPADDFPAVAKIIRQTRLPQPLEELDLAPIFSSMRFEVDPCLALKDRKPPTDDEAHTLAKFLLSALYRVRTNSFQPLDIFLDAFHLKTETLRHANYPLKGNEREQLQILKQWYNEIDEYNKTHSENHDLQTGGENKN